MGRAGVVGGSDWDPDASAMQSNVPVANTS